MLRTLSLLMLVATISGCTQVVHMMRDEPIEPDPHDTTLGTDLDDWQMDTAIGVNIKKAHPGLEKAPIRVTVYNRVVLLTGEVDTQELRRLAGETAAKFHGVRQVHNELLITEDAGFLSRTNDSIIATKVNSKLLVSKEVDSGHIKVVVSNGQVYLMGKVDRVEGDRAAQIASETGGVIRVVKVYEYLD